MTSNTEKNSVHLNAMTVDVEDFFQVSAFEAFISRENWQNYAGRVEANTDRILEMFDEHQVRGTFFTLGWVAEHYPELVKRIVDQGHDLSTEFFFDDETFFGSLSVFVPLSLSLLPTFRVSCQVSPASTPPYSQPLFIHSLV